MSTIAINTFLTLDGVAQAPGGPDEDVDGGFAHGGWSTSYFGEQVGGIIWQWHESADALLFGRVTYDILGGYWPRVPADHDDAAMAKLLNEAPKYVASRTRTEGAWQNSTVLSGDVVTAVRELKDQDLGEVLVIGSLDLAQTLIRHDLIDEFRLTVFPVVLGTGKRLFGDGTIPTSLELVSATPTDTGVVACVYRRAGKPTYGSFEL